MLKDPKYEPIPVKMTYPHSTEYDITARIEVIDLDVEAEKDIESGLGFEISSGKSSG